ncbi:MAG: hypothetical protein NVS4B3_24980 [Gemmatimonadaceae bacterium]
MFWGVYAVVWGGVDLWRGIASGRWPRVTARVVRSEVVTGNLRYTRFPSLAAVMLFEWTFTIAGKVYFDSRLRFGPVRDSVARRIIAHYPVGATVEVAYDPRDPDRSVFEPGPTLPSAVIVGVGAIVIAFGAGWLGNALRAG